MNKFFFLLWLHWSIRLTLYSVLSASLLSLCVTLYVYLQGSQEFNTLVYDALLHIFGFWFGVFWSLALLLYLFRGLKDIFNHCHNSYKFILFECPKEGKKEQIEVIGYGDLVQVWRKWFMLLIWLVASEILLGIISMKLFSTRTSIFEWFNIYSLYFFILLAAYISFIVLKSRCKRIKLVKC